jgi:hypothetical protein
MGRFLRGRPSLALTLAHLHVRSRHTPSASSGRCQVGPCVSWTPLVRLTSSRAGNRYAPDPLPRPSSLKPIPLLYCNTAGRHRPNPHLASSSLAPRCVGTVRCPAHARRLATASTLPVQLTSPTPVYGQNFHPLACSSRHPLLPSLRSAPRECTLDLPPREPSPPSLSPCACPCWLYAIHSYKRDLPRAFCMCPHRCLPLVRRHHRTTSVFCRSIGAKPPHPPLSPCAGPGALQGPRAAPRLAHVTSSPPLSSTSSGNALPSMFLDFWSSLNIRRG